MQQKCYPTDWIQLEILFLDNGLQREDIKISSGLIRIRIVLELNFLMQESESLKKQNKEPEQDRQELFDENQQLRQENQQLKQELVELKSQVCLVDGEIRSHADYWDMDDSI